MRRTIVDAIKDGRAGLEALITNNQVLALIGEYSLDEDAKQRIQREFFRDRVPFFILKRDNINLEPAPYLGREILQYDDETIKWFLLLYCVSSASALLKEKVLDYTRYSPSACLGNDNGHDIDYLDLNYVSEDQLDHLLDGLIDIDWIISKRLPKYAGSFDGFEGDTSDYGKRRRTNYRIGISQFLLTAGYHYIHDTETVPHEIRSRRVDMPFILSGAKYISIITGEEFYGVLRSILVKKGAQRRFDDILAMIENSIKLEELRAEKERLEYLLSENKENQRKQETAGEIINESLGKGILKDAMDERIKKCNDKAHRDILYKCEALAGEKLSFLTPLCETRITAEHIEGTKKEYGVIFSHKENDSIITIENFADTLLRHVTFIEEFKKATLSHRQLEPISDNNPYDIETRIREIESLFGISVDREKVHSVHDLQCSVSDDNPVFFGIVSLFVDKLGVEPEEVKMESSLTNDLGADSLDTIELIMEAKRQYGIRIPNESLYGVHTVGDIYKVVLDFIQGKEEFSHLLKKNL